jgi:beta-lactamase class A
MPDHQSPDPAGATAPAAASPSPRAGLPDAVRERIDAEIDRFLKQASDTATPDAPEPVVSVWYGGIDGESWYARAALEPHYAASTMKLPLLIAAYRRHERGELDLDREVPVHNGFTSAADGSAYALLQEDDQDDEIWDLARASASASLRELVRHAIVKSGNLATNLVLERVGAGEVATVLGDAGSSGVTVLPRGIGDARARDGGLDNLVTAQDLATVVAAVATRSIAGESTCVEIERVLAAQEHVDKIPAGLPAGTYTANKTGWVESVAHDVALVRPEGRPPFVLAVCTTAAVPEETANQLIARVAELVWQGAVG